MADKIIVREVVWYDSYYEVTCDFILTVPAWQIAKKPQDPTKTVSAIVPFGINEEDLVVIKAKLIAKHTELQAILDNDYTLYWYGYKWDGSTWAY